MEDEKKRESGLKDNVMGFNRQAAERKGVRVQMTGLQDVIVNDADKRMKTIRTLSQSLLGCRYIDQQCCASCKNHRDSDDRI